ncbi:unnamed protein product, partial [Adineta steineri]
KLIQSSQIILPRLLFRFIQHLRSHATPISNYNTYTTIEEFISLTPLFDLFDDLCNSGSSIRSIFTNCLLSIELYDLSNDYEIYFEQLNETSCLFIPTSLYTTNLSIYFPIKKATCLLDELLFWLIKYHIPEL